MLADGWSSNGSTTRVWYSMKGVFEKFEAFEAFEDDII